MDPAANASLGVRAWAHLASPRGAPVVPGQEVLTLRPPSLLCALLGGSSPTVAMATHSCLPGGQTASRRNLCTGPRPSSLSLISSFCRPPPPASLVGTRALNGVGPGFEFHLRLPRLLSCLWVCSGQGHSSEKITWPLASQSSESRRRRDTQICQPANQSREWSGEASRRRQLLGA